MSNWKGYFIRAIASNRIFPLKFIAEKTWKCTPKQREEVKAYRDDNTRDLYRVTAAGKKTKMTFSTRENLHEADVEEMLDFFTSAEVDHEQRKIQLEYWDNSNHRYDTGYFYRPNMDFKVNRVSKTDIIYDSLDLELIEY